MTLPLTVLLDHFDRNNLEIYEGIRNNEEARKELDQLLNYVLPVWISGTYRNEDQINLIPDFNEQVNVGWYESKDHPELRARVLACIGSGRKISHKFYRYRRKVVPSHLNEFLSQLYFDIRDNEIRTWCMKNNEHELIALCEEEGLQKAEIKPILDDYRNILEE